jgi:hypothetical protein
VVTVRYQATDGTSQELIIPVCGDGLARPSSVVSIPDYQPGTEGQAWLAPPGGQAWPPETVQTSVLATASSGTARAWERLAAMLPAATGEVIERGLRMLRGNA